jgi:hypothetical protein
VVKKIWQSRADGQTLDPPIEIEKATIEVRAF